MIDRVLENDLDMDEMIEVAEAPPQDKAPAERAPVAEKAPAADKAAARTVKSAPTLLPDKGASLWDDDDPADETSERDVTGDRATRDPDDADDNDEADAGDDDTSGDKGEADDKADDKAKAEEKKPAEAAATDPTSWPLYTRLVKQLEARLKNSVTAANYDKEMKKGTEAIKAQLSRYRSPEDFMVAGWNAQQRIRSGELAPKALRKDATPAEAAAWRKAQGIPEKAADYNVPKVAGHDWQEHDAPVLNSFKNHFHKAGLSQAQVDTVMTAYANELQQAYKARDQAFATLDREDRIQMEETLRADPDIGNSAYRPTLQLVKRLLNDPEYISPQAAAKMKTSRSPAGNLMMHDPLFVKFLAKIAEDRYGGAGEEERRVTTSQRMSSRKAEIEKVMDESMDTYYRDAAMQAEYAEILQQEQNGGRRERRR